jgi:glycosyltransferase involved in cell wall biosynthesis
MKILHVVPFFGIGGMERVICSLINGISAYNHEILVLYDNIEASKWLKNGKNINIKCLNRSRDQLQFLRMLYKSIVETKSDLLMTYAWGATDAIWLGRIAGIKKIIHNEHGFNMDEARSTSFKRDIIRIFLYHMASRIIVVSQELKKMMNEKFHLKERNVILIENGIDTNIYFPDPYERMTMRKSLGFGETDFIVGFCGRLDAVKNFNFMLDILVECIRKDKRVNLLLIGDGPEKKNIEEQSRKKHIEKNVLFVGQKENVVPYLRVLDVFLLTSLREQMPMTILEAMALALPVISTDVGEVGRIIEHGKDGIVWNLHEKPEKFAMSLLDLRDKMTLQRMGASSRQKILSGFTEGVMVQKYQEIIDSLTFSH